MSFVKTKILILMILVLGLVSALENSSPHFLGRGLFHRLHHLDPPPSHSGKTRVANDQWFDQRLDHFNALDTRKWQQRYFSR